MEGREEGMAIAGCRLPISDLGGTGARGRGSLYFLQMHSMRGCE